MVTLPPSGRYKPAMSLSMVDLPAPLGPSKPKMVPDGMVTDKSFKARTRPNRLVTRSNTTVAMGLTSPARLVPLGQGPRVGPSAGFPHDPLVRAPHHGHHLLAPVRQRVHLPHEPGQDPSVAPSSCSPHDPLLRAPHHGHHLLAPVPQRVHLPHETGQGPVGHLPADLRDPLGIAGDEGPLAPQSFGYAHQFHLPIR